MGNLSVATKLSTVAVDVDSQLVTVKPSDAKRWIDNSMWGKQRPYRDWHAEGLAEAMRRGEFTEGTQVHFAKLDGQIYCVNGQHTLNAVVKFNNPIRLTVSTTVVSSESEIAAIYSRHDRHVQRSLSDSYDAYDLCNELGLSKNQINIVGGGIKFIIGDFGVSSRKSNTYKGRSIDERIRGFAKYGTVAKDFFDAVSGASANASKALRLSSVVGVALITFERAPTQAKEFWSQVAFSDALSIADPRKTLINWLMANDVRKVNHASRSRAVAHAWNVFLAGGKLPRIKTPDWTQPIVINSV